MRDQASNNVLSSRKHEHAVCRECGYCLNGLTVPRCPECGTAFKEDDPRLACSPEMHRMRRRQVVLVVVYGSAAALNLLWWAWCGQRFQVPPSVWLGGALWASLGPLAWFMLALKDPFLFCCAYSVLVPALHMSWLVAVLRTRLVALPWPLHLAGACGWYAIGLPPASLVLT